MVANKMIRPADVTQAKAAHFGAEVVNSRGMKIEDDVIAAVPRAHRQEIPRHPGLSSTRTR